jgi:hypothetical protein
MGAETPLLSRLGALKPPLSVVNTSTNIIFITDLFNALNAACQEMLDIYQLNNQDSLLFHYNSTS